MVAVWDATSEWSCLKLEAALPFSLPLDNPLDKYGRSTRRPSHASHMYHGFLNNSNNNTTNNSNKLTGQQDGCLIHGLHCAWQRSGQDVAFCG